MSPILDGADQLAFVDVDDTIRETHGYHKEGVGYGYSKVKGLDAQLATLSTPVAAPVIAATRLRKGNVASAHGATRLIGDALATLRKATTPGLVIVRADSAYFSHDTIAAITAGGARFSITARMNPAVTTAIASIDEQVWTPIRYPRAIWDEAQQVWISDAEVAEVSYTAFTSRPRGEQVTARLNVRRVKRLNPGATLQAELLPLMTRRRVGLPVARNRLWLALLAAFAVSVAFAGVLAQGFRCAGKAGPVPDRWAVTGPCSRRWTRLSLRASRLGVRTWSTRS